jgi:hypothetical protein
MNENWATLCMPKFDILYELPMICHTDGQQQGELKLEHQPIYINIA